MRFSMMIGLPVVIALAGCNIQQASCIGQANARIDTVDRQISHLQQLLAQGYRVVNRQQEVVRFGPCAPPKPQPKPPHKPVQKPRPAAKPLPVPKPHKGAPLTPAQLKKREAAKRLRVEEQRRREAQRKPQPAAMCRTRTIRTVQQRVPIDRGAVRARLIRLQAERAALLPQANAAVAACKLQYPD